MSGIKDKMIVIADATSGIDEATALLLVDRGAKVLGRAAGMALSLWWLGSRLRAPKPVLFSGSSNCVYPMPWTKVVLDVGPTREPDR
jgi:hypothetical protein